MSLANLLVPPISSAQNPFKGFMTYRGTSDQVNRRGAASPRIRVDTSGIEKNLRRNKSINDSLGPLGKLNVQWLGTKPAQGQRNFVPGYGWVDVSKQGARQIEAARRRIEGAPNRNTSRSHQNNSAQRSQTAAAGSRRHRAPNLIGNAYLTAIRENDKDTIAGMLKQDELVRQSLHGLILTTPSESESVSTTMQNEVQNHFANLNTGFGVSEFVAGILPERIGKVHPQSNGNFIAEFAYSDEGVRGTGRLELTSIDAPESRALAIIDIQLPSRHMTLREWYQYQIIAELPKLPELTQKVGQGRLSQASDVRRMLQMDATQREQFQEHWSGLSDHAKTWPISQFKHQQYEVQANQQLLTKERLNDLKSAGVRSDSLQWVQAKAKTNLR